MLRTGLFALALIACAACNPSLTVPPEAQISCREAADCPAGFQCAATIERCVPSSNGDTTSPSISGVAFDETLLRQGATALLTFESSEPLFAPPEVSLVLPAGRLALALDEAASSAGEGRAWAYRYTATGTEPQDESGVPVEISLVDQVGNQAERLPAGRLRFDFFAPEITVTVPPAKAAFRDGDVASLTFTVSEPIVGEPLVTLSTGEVLVRSSLSGASTFTYEYVVTGAHGADAHPIAIAVADAAGNVEAVADAAQLRFDSVAPSIVGTPALPFERARAGMKIQLDFEVDEPLGELPGFTVAGLPGLVVPVDTGGYRAVFDVASSHPNGPSTLQLHLEDLAGNTHTHTLAQTIDVDTVAPQVTEKLLPSTPQRSSSAGPHFVTFRFSVSEPLFGPPEFDLDVGGAFELPSAIACVQIWVGMTYECSFEMPASPGPASTGVLTVFGEDAAGNGLAEGLGTVKFDFEPPVVRAAGPRELIPQADNPNPFPSAAKAGTTVRVRIATSEPAAALPTVRARRTGGVLTVPFAIVDGEIGDQLFSAEYTPGPMAPNGAFDVLVTAVDSAGNQSAETKVAEFGVDTVVPLPASQANLRYRRFPWGDEAGARRFEVASDPTAVEPLSIVVVRDENRSALNSIRARLDGGFEVISILADYPRVFLTQIDGAGNESAMQLVQTVEWTATLGGKVPGSLGSNPHYAGARSTFVGSLFQDDLELPTAGADVATIGSDGLQGAPGSGYFRSLHTRNPSTLFGSAMVFDGARGRAVLFGGERGKLGAVDELWEWDGLKWEEKFPVDPEGDGNPSPRHGHAMAYDSRRGKVVLFGGEFLKTKLDDFWEYDGRSWKRVQYGTVSPSPRARAAMVFDSRRNTLVIHGGDTDFVSADNTTWAYNTVKSEWASSTFPGLERHSHTLTYDPQRGEIVLFGGSDSTQDHDSTWVWREALTGAFWDEVKTEAPPELTARRGHAAAYDATVGGILLFGGSSAGTLSMNDTFIFRDGAWSRYEVKTPPLARERAVMTFDTARREVILFGGVGADFYDDTWKWTTSDGEPRWIDLSGTPLTPPGRVGATLAYNNSARGSVLFGGQDVSGALLGDTWAFDGYRWRPLGPIASPPALVNAATVDARTGGRNILFGGRDASATLRQETWELRRTVTGAFTWNLLAPAISPGPRQMHAMTLFAGGALLFGGEAAGFTLRGDTWFFDGTTWSNVAPEGGPGRPAPRRLHAMAESPGGGVVLFGGQTTFGLNNDTWVWSGGAWTQITPPVSPKARWGHMLAFDPSRKRTYLFGGVDSLDNRLTDIWEWDGSTWTETSVFDPYGEGRPKGRSRSAATFDPLNERIVFFGGQRNADTQSIVGDTWVWDSGAKSRAGHVFLADLQSAQVGVDQLTEASIRVCAGATADGGVHGVSLRIWDQNQWSPAYKDPKDPIEPVENTAPAEAPECLIGNLRTEELTRILFGPSMYLPVAVVPIVDNGLGANINLDYVDVRVTYTAR